MKPILFIIKNLKNIIPYLIIVAIYFFFINLEAQKEKNKSTNNKRIFSKEKLSLEKPMIKNQNSRILIPVIPYNK